MESETATVRAAAATCHRRGWDAGSRRQRRPGRWSHAPLDPLAEPAVDGMGERHMPPMIAPPESAQASRILGVLDEERLRWAWPTGRQGGAIRHDEGVAGVLAGLERGRRQALLEDLNYLNLAELRSLCDQYAIPYRIVAGTKITHDVDRKPVVVQRVRHFLLTGEVAGPTVLPAEIVRPDRPPEALRPSDRLYYRWYNKTYEPVLRLLTELTGGRFRNGALARVLAMEFWTRGQAPTFTEFADAWIAAADEPRQLLSDEYAFLTDRHCGTAGPDWKVRRERRAKRFLTTIANLR